VLEERLDGFQLLVLGARALPESTAQDTARLDLPGTALISGAALLALLLPATSRRGTDAAVVRPRHEHESLVDAVLDEGK
jgi:hypothetical protein